MSVKILVCAALLGTLLAHVAHAVPILTVTPLGLNGSSDREWGVYIAQDAVPGALAAELAFAIDGANLLDVVVGDPTIWDFPLPGSNPFTSTSTEGIYIDLITDRSFAAYGSAIVTSTVPTHFLKITTAGAGFTTIRYGTAASNDVNKGNIIANSQEGISRYSGSASVPEPASAALAFVVCCAVVPFLRARTRD